MTDVRGIKLVDYLHISVNKLSFKYYMYSIYVEQYVHVFGVYINFVNNIILHHFERWVD